MAAERDVAEVRSFISESWSSTVRHTPHDHADLLALPYPYTVPSVSDTFQEMYYWDTFFTNQGLIIDGQIDQAICNTENVAHLVNRFGKMLNGNRTWFENRSQPPFLAMMVDRIYDHTGDQHWLRRMFPTVVREYSFWMTHRLTPCGLNRYSHDGTLADEFEMLATINDRLGPRLADQATAINGHQRAIGSHHLAEAESGWDFTPRFEGRCQHFCPVDLNANLHLYETTFSRWSSALGRSDADDWDRRARRRRHLLRRHCRNPTTGMFHDYDFVADRQSPVASAAIFSLLYGRAVSPSDAAWLLTSALNHLELRHGVVACARANYEYPYQWSYPNSWAPLTYLAVAGLRNYGYRVDATRIARKYVDVVTRNFGTTGNLWEKYSAVDGTVATSNEYSMPTMMGWTAGTFVWADEMLGADRS